MVRTAPESMFSATMNCKKKCTPSPVHASGFGRICLSLTMVAMSPPLVAIVRTALESMFLPATELRMPSPEHSLDSVASVAPVASVSSEGGNDSSIGRNGSHSIREHVPNNDELHMPSTEHSLDSVASVAHVASVSNDGRNESSVGRNGSHSIRKQKHVPSNDELHMPTPEHSLDSVASVAPVAYVSSKGRNDSSVGRNDSEGCWKANRLCETMRDYVRRNGLTHIFIGASAKVAGSSVTTFFALGHHRKIADFAAHIKETRCSWAISGSHLGHYMMGLSYYLRERCAPKTLFLLPLREEVSWMRSALKQECWVRKACGDLGWLMRALKQKRNELHAGPHIWIEEWMIRSPEFHTFMFDISAINDVLACLPPGGLEIEKSSELALHVYKRDNPIIHANTEHVHINISDDAMLAGYKKGKYTAYWVQPYVKAINESDCEVASALGLEVALRRIGKHASSNDEPDMPSP